LPQAQSATSSKEITMATILDSLGSIMTSDVIAKVGKATGTDASLIGKGLGAIGPL
jgi:hypothetical protein